MSSYLSPPAAATALFTQDRDEIQALSLLQTATDRVAEWSKAPKKMQLSTDKSEVTFFSSDNREAAWIPSASLNGWQMPFNPNPKLLRVYLDRTLTYGHHVEVVSRKASARCRVISSLAGKSWGWEKSNLRRVYQALIAPVTNYAAAGWQPWISKSRLEELERTQNCALPKELSSCEIEDLYINPLGNWKLNWFCQSTPMRQITHHPLTTTIQ